MQLRFKKLVLISQIAVKCSQKPLYAIFALAKDSESVQGPYQPKKGQTRLYSVRKAYLGKKSHNCYRRAIGGNIIITRREKQL